MIQLSKKVTAILLIAVSLIALFGCTPASNPLDKTQWNLIGWTLSSLSPTDFKITANFADGKIAGNSGVNSYSGSYTLGPGEAFLAERIAGTLMAGPEPAMRAETAYLTLLGQAKSYKLTGGKLTLYDKDGNESLIFEANK